MPHMKRAILLLPLIWPTVGLPAYLNGNTLLDRCKGNVTEQPYCIGYLTGIADLSFTEGWAMLRVARSGIEEIKNPERKANTRKEINNTLKDYACIPSNVPVGQLRLVFVRWATAHRGQLHGPADDLAKKAFRETWPCRF